MIQIFNIQYSQFELQQNPPFKQYPLYIISTKSKTKQHSQKSPLVMSQLYEILKPKSKYYDKNNFNTQQQYDQAVRVSSTVYVGNLSYLATQDSIKELFSRAGKVKRIIMGINNQGQRCGFCFVIFQTHQDAQRAVQYISQTKLGEKTIRVDLDPGYKEGRQKGRGRDGNQKRDDYRNRHHQDDRYKNKFQDRGERGDRGDRYDRGDRGDRYDRRGGQRNYGKQRSREYNEQPEDERYHKQGAPRKMGKKEFEQKQDEEY